jgi:CubicO group peptidase (beta-lactamase class C family)
VSIPGRRPGSARLAFMTTAAGLRPDRFRELARSLVAGGTVPGLVALMAHGDDVTVEAVGRLSIDGPPVRRDSLFRIASTSKPISAAAGLVLADEGLLDLHEPVDRLLPELADRRVLRRMDGPLGDTVPAQRSITPHDLLTFTFGFGMVVEMFMSPAPWPIVAVSDELSLNTIGPPMPDAKPDPDTWIARFGSLPLLAQPGERWLYNTGMHALGVLVERAAGMPFADVLRSRIFEPLGMRDTAFFAADTSRLATSYISTPDGLAVWDAPDGQWSHPPLFADGAAGLVSTADDLLAFARMLLRGGGPVLSADAVRLMTTDRLTPEQKAAGGLGRDFFASSGWGYGVAVTTDGPRAGSFGWDGGLGTSFLVDPARDLAVVVLTQRMFDTAEAPQWHRALQDAAYDVLVG